ncbi:MAG TPA: hypothetical protein VHV57_00300 [Acidimicrobiales bacterium]|jgi:hypothetical protein|nr:hypothetical protein [Acidimicrobiales bacterium]
MRIIFVPVAIAIIVVSALLFRPIVWFFITLPCGLAVVGLTLGGRHGSSELNGFDNPEFG